MTGVSLGKTAKENSRETWRGVYLTAPKDDPGIH